MTEVMGRRLRSLEAVVALTAAGLLLRALSFARIVRLWRRPRDARPPAEADARAVAAAVQAAAARLPWEARCFERGLAAMTMLRRRGFSPTLCYGARDEGEALRAHVWVRLGEHPVTGWEEAEGFALLAQFPEGA